MKPELLANVKQAPVPVGSGNLLGAYVQILKFCVLNFMLPNRMANARAKGMYESAEIIRTMDSSLPAANLQYLRSLSRAAKHPTHKNLSRNWRHHLLRSLRICNGPKSQSHHQNTIEAEILKRLERLPKRTAEFCKCMSYAKAPNVES
jgi:hypothetical protein